MQGLRLDESAELDYCAVCATLTGLDSAESLIAWGPGATIRSGDIVITEYDCRDGTAIAYLKAERRGDRMVLRTRCGRPDLIVQPGRREARSALITVRITGVARGAFRAF